ncbi:Uncharacterized protein SCF082_LOCUS17855, partial [Durusdinium trenchii]
MMSDGTVRRKRHRLPRVATEGIPGQPFSMPALPQKTLGVSKSSPVLRRDEGKAGKLPMLVSGTRASLVGHQGRERRRSSVKLRAASHPAPTLPPVQDLRLQAMALCKRHQMSFSEVMLVLEALRASSQDKTGGMPMERFRTFMTKALYVEHVNDDLLRSAYQSCATSGSINVDEFLNWCK